MNYSERILGLDAVRAFAVLIVVFYHFGIPGFGFGYLGVDVFFTLSGFLMVHIVLKAQTEGGKRLGAGEFLRRRFQRLAPAFAVVAALTLLAAILIYPPSTLSDVAQQVGRAATLNANLYFMEQAGYFEPSSARRPFLHAWSLSVEEQFYLLFALLLGLSRWIRFSWLILAAFAASVVPYVVSLVPGPETVSLYGTAEDLGKRQFFDLQFRAIQLASGGVLRLAFDRGVVRSLGWMPGAVLVAASCAALIVLHQVQPPQGVLNLGATLCACALLLPNAALDRMAGWPGVSRVAACSYQWYLTHWPVAVFASYLWVVPIPFAGRLSLMVFSFALALGVMRVTRAFGLARRWRAAPILAGIVGVCIAVSAQGGWGWRSSGPLAMAETFAASSRSAESAYCQGTHLDEGRPLGARPTDPLETCVYNKDADRTLYVLGDSHARHLLPGLAEAYPDYRIAILYRSSCIAENGSYDYRWNPSRRPESGPACRDRNARALAQFAGTPSSPIIVSAYEGYGGIGTSSGSQGVARRGVVDRLEGAGHRVVWLSPVVHPDRDLSDCAALPRTLPKVTWARLCEGDTDVAERVLDSASELSRDVGASVVDGTRFFCPSGKTPCRTSGGGHLLFRDTHHLTVDGSIAYVQWLRDNRALDERLGVTAAR